jgi:hypothetical protein
MPADVQHGVLGLEAIHNITGRIDMNVQGSLPRIKLDRIGGLHSLNDADDFREDNYARSGETAYISHNRGRTITYEGRLFARNVLELRELGNDLRRACAFSRQTEGDFEIRPHPFMGGYASRYRGRTLALEIDDEWTTNYGSVIPYQRHFVLTIRCGDHRFYIVGKDVNMTAANAATLAVNNEGSTGALPAIIVNGPIAGTLLFERLDNFVYRNLTYDLSDDNLAAGQQIKLDFYDRSLRRVSDDASYEHLRVFDESNWFDSSAAALNPGLSHVKVSGGGNWNIQFSPANG